MDKKDLAFVAVALVIILVVALIIKPMVTGQPVNTGLPVPTTEPPVEVLETPYSIITTAAEIPATPTPVPTPMPTWNETSVPVEFVDPSTYGLSFNQSLPGYTRFDNVPTNATTTIYSTITGQYSGTTQMIDIPFPYWEIWYSVDPAGLPMGKEQKLSSESVKVPKGAPTSAGGSGSTVSVIGGSYSVVNPQFILQVMDGNDPNRIVRTITPPGGLDESLWEEKRDDDENVISTDPRPWIEKFYEGQRKYFFIITTQTLDSYTIEIRIPNSYIGKY